MADQLPSPSVGRVVHFVNGDKHVPAIITDPEAHFSADAPDEPGTQPQIGQALTVFPVHEMPFTTVAVYDPLHATATWHWPEFVPPKTDTSLLTPATVKAFDPLKPPPRGNKPDSFA